MQTLRRVLSLGEFQRVVTACFPDRSISGPPLVLFCADGQSTPAFANAFFRTRPRTSRVCFIGIDSCPNHRNGEYVDGRDPVRFAQHEAFWTEVVWQWAEQEVGHSLTRKQTGVFGFSCGGSFAASMGIRHPHLYGVAFAFSIAGRPISNFRAPSPQDLSQSSFFLRAGSREPTGMRTYMKRFHSWLKKQNAASTFAIESGGHDLASWSSQLNAILEQTHYA